MRFLHARNYNNAQARRRWIPAEFSHLGIVHCWPVRDRDEAAFRATYPEGDWEEVMPGPEDRIIAVPWAEIDSFCCHRIPPEYHTFPVYPFGEDHAIFREVRWVFPGFGDPDFEPFEGEVWVNKFQAVIITCPEEIRGEDRDIDWFIGRYNFWAKISKEEMQ